jgi:hypothetical protein
LANPTRAAGGNLLQRRGGAGVLGRGRARPQGGRAARRELGDVKYVYTRDGERIFKVVSFYLLRAMAALAWEKMRA